MPIAGIVLLGWKVAPLLLVYYIDTMAYIGAATVLACHQFEENDAVGSSVVFLVVAGVFGLPIYWLGRDLELDGVLAAACLIQAALAGQSVYRRMLAADRRVQLEFSERRREHLRNVAGDEFLVVIARWLLTLIFAATPWAMVAVYLSITIWCELWPPAIMARKQK